MVKVVRITREEKSRPFTDCILVDVTHAGPVRAIGATNQQGNVLYFASPMFPNVRTALVAATAWAEQHGIDTVHLYADDSKLLDDCASLEVLSEEAQANTVDQARVVEQTPAGPERLEAERVLAEMRYNEASVELNRSLNDCD